MTNNSFLASLIFILHEFNEFLFSLRCVVLQSLNLYNTSEIFSRLSYWQTFWWKIILGGVLCESWADRKWSGSERNVGKYDSVPVCGRAGEPSGTTILVCDFGVPSLMVVSTRFRLRFFTGGEKHEAPLFQSPAKAQCRARFFDRRAILLFSSIFLI